MSYESPIKLTNTMDSIVKRVREEGDKKIYECIANYGIDVNKEELEKALRYDRDQYVKGYEDGKAEAMQWIPCSERLPDNEQEVEITYISKHWKTGEPLYFTCRAFYTDGTMNTEESNYVWNEIDNWEYNESFDAYIIPEGWWEGVSFAEEFFPIDKPVIAWMPPPAPFIESED